jgi:hypothetical protein
MEHKTKWRHRACRSCGRDTDVVDPKGRLYGVPLDSPIRVTSRLSITFKITSILCGPCSQKEANDHVPFLERVKLMMESGLTRQQAETEAREWERL